LPTTILAVDDQPESLEALRVVLSDIRLLIREPALVTEHDLLTADLVLVDLKLTEWLERSSSGVLATWPEDGLALLAVFRSHVARLNKTRPTSFAIHSSFLDETWPGLPPDYRAHALARLHDIEWIFSKADAVAGDQSGRQFVSLAQATQSLPISWPQGDFERTRAQVAILLGMNRRVKWFQQAWQDVEHCHPPTHDLAAPSHGPVFLRWLIQRILPYPCFLWDERQLGARLGMVPDGLSEALSGKSVVDGLERARYRGILDDFLGRRWWRTGVEAFLWQLTRGASSDVEAIHDALRRGGIQHGVLPRGHTTICLDDSFRPLQGLYPAADCVRIQPDDWPAYADPAWTTISRANDSPKLRALVLADDRDRLEHPAD
jgi:hypothetical protein